jgi:Protein phosphatase 2C
VWRYVYASVTGVGHRRREEPGQDVSACALVPGADGSELLVACVADGAGSAPRGGDGARAACATFADAVAADLTQGEASPVAGSDAWSRFVADWLTGFHGAVAAQADSDGGRARDYACTFLGAVVAPDRAALVQIGDGAIVVDVGDPGEYRAFVWPQRGEYANETFFATDPAAFGLIACEVFDRRIEEIALLTDGLQGMVLDQQHQLPHAPFFGRMFRVLRGAPPGHSPTLSSALATFLGSPSVHQRTDDDVTLVLATRRNGVGC